MADPQYKALDSITTIEDDELGWFEIKERDVSAIGDPGSHSLGWPSQGPGQCDFLFWRCSNSAVRKWSACRQGGSFEPVAAFLSIRAWR